MKKAVKKHTSLFMIALLGFLVLCLVELKAIYWGGLDKPTAFSLINATAIVSFLILASVGTFIFVIFLLPSPYLFEFKKRLQSQSAIQWSLFVACSLLPAWILLYSYWGSIFISPILRIWLVFSTWVIMTFLISKEEGNLLDFKSFLVSVVVAVSMFLIANRLREVVDYPFTLYWSEGNRFWDYSIMFGRDRYLYQGEQPIYAFIDLGRQSLWGLPFLLGNPSIALMRLWNVILFTLPYILLGYLIFKKNHTPKAIIILCALWTYLFLSQGPIYTPLILAAILVVIADRSPLGIGILLVLISGYYANLTRYSWSIAPAIWAGLLGLLQPTQMGGKLPIVDWVKTILFVAAGLGGGLLLPILLPITGAAVQGSQPAILSTAQATLQNQALLWSRLLPNATNPTGILPGLFLAVLPVLLLTGYLYKKSGVKLNIWQATGVIGSSLLFLIAGLVASIKIGGGSNLHNLDMFLVNILFLSGVAWRGDGQEWLLNLKPKPMWIKPILVFMIVFPAAATILESTPLRLPSTQDQQNAMNAIQRNVHEAKARGEVLFIDQRQLLTFGYIQDVPLVPEYEKKFLMDKAMSGDTELFNNFYQDLRSHRFSLIINEPIYIEYQAEEVNFGTENDIWVKWVSEPLLCYYEPLASYNHVNVELLIPRETPQSSSEGCP